MSRHFDANQYERSFRPQLLRNWEVVRRYPHERPRARRGHTKIIADDRGHLLPGVPRIEPWCHFRSTWQLPKRITRKLARDINTLRPSGKHLTSWEKRSYHAPLLDKNHSSRLPSATREKRRNSGKKEIPIVEERDAQNFQETQQPEEEHERDYSLPVAACRNPKVVDASERVRKDIESYQEASQPDSSKKEPPAESPPMSSRNSLKSMSSHESNGVKSNALEVDFISSQFAKTLAQDNLKHKPLPDAITNKALQTRQMKKDSQPKLALDEVPLNATAVGHRKYKSPGPTQCSKLNVFRPQTAVPKKTSSSMAGDKKPFDKQLGPIDLAICWDLTPRDHIPRRSLHIDGTNDVAGPSIFNIVKTPRDDVSDGGGPELKTAWEDKPVNPSAVMDIINNNSEVTGKVGSHKKEELEKDRKSNGSSRRSSKGSQENRNPNISPNEGGGRVENSISSIDSDKLKKAKHHRSSPNLSTCGVENSKSKQKMLFSRPCMACETKEVHTESAALRRPKSDYKMAFKAGVPNHTNSSNNSHRSEHNGNRPLTGRHQVSVPRPKTPFAKKNYSINSLAPPFSLWPGTTGMDYPEHWRLASVYQHSFKPIEQRKKPFLQGVYH